MIHIAVQAADFSVQQEYDRICSDNSADGAVVFFVGRVRDLNAGEAVYAMTLEHYPGMTEQSLLAIVSEAQARWPLSRVRVIHRVGQLAPADQIVFVATASPHREAAFAGAQFIMDWLKTRAPIWKKETTERGEHWLQAKTSDADKAEQW